MTIQSAALPFRREADGSLSVLLVTSRTRKRWILPKGKIGARMLASRSAEREAFEEAGVLGRIGKAPIGVYQQGDELSPGIGGAITVQAYPLEVTDELPVWEEMHLRERRWFTLKKALRVVRDPEIRTILRALHRQARKQVQS